MESLIIKWVLLPVLGLLSGTAVFYAKSLIKRVENCATKEYVELRIRPIEQKIDNLDKKIDKLLDLQLRRNR